MIVVHEQLRKCIYSEEKIQNGEVVLERKKIKNAVLFKIKAFFHKRRDELESKKDDLLFEKNVVKEVIKAFIKNICIIALILFLEQILVSEKCDGIFPMAYKNG